jgi:hypothetical protein
MTYIDALIANISRDEARREILLHGASWAEFTEEFGDREEYIGEEVLAFLGY